MVRLHTVGLENKTYHSPQLLISYHIFLSTAGNFCVFVDILGS